MLRLALAALVGLALGYATAALTPAPCAPEPEETTLIREALKGGERRALPGATWAVYVFCLTKIFCPGHLTFESTTPILIVRRDGPAHGELRCQTATSSPPTQTRTVSRWRATPPSPSFPRPPAPGSPTRCRSATRDATCSLWRS